MAPELTCGWSEGEIEHLEKTGVKSLVILDVKVPFSVAMQGDLRLHVPLYIWHPGNRAAISINHLLSRLGVKGDVCASR